MVKQSSQASTTSVMRGLMSHFCFMCERYRPNEQFSGRGHSRHICKACQKLPKETREARQTLLDLYQLLRQPHISDKNLQQLEAWMESSDPEVQRQARLVREVALVKPHKRKRLALVAKERPELLPELEETGLIHAMRNY